MGYEGLSETKKLISESAQTGKEAHSD